MSSVTNVTSLPKDTWVMTICPHLSMEDCVKLMRVSKFFFNLRITDENRLTVNFVMSKIGFKSFHLEPLKPEPLPPGYYREVYKTCGFLNKTIKVYIDASDRNTFAYWNDKAKIEKAKRKLIKNHSLEGLLFLFVKAMSSYRDSLSYFHFIHLASESKNIQPIYFAKLLKMLLPGFIKETPHYNSPAIHNNYNLITAATDLKLHEIMRVLLALKHNHLQEDGKQRSAITIAVEKEDEEAVKILLKAIPNPNFIRPGKSCPYFYELLLSIEPSLRILSLFLDAGVDIHKKYPVHTRNEIDEYSVIHFACSHGKMEVVKLLLTRGANLEEKTKKGYTPLQLAIKASWRNLTEFLIYEKNADISVKDPDDLERSILHHASSLADFSSTLASHLIKKGLDPKEPDKSGSTCLHFIAEKKGDNEKAIQFFLEYIPIDAKDNDGKTPLLVAASFGNIETVKYLINKGADISLCDNDGNTALLDACAYGRHECALYLIGQGSKVIQENFYRVAPLDNIKDEKNEVPEKAACAAIVEYEKKRAYFTSLNERFQAVLSGEKVLFEAEDYESIVTFLRDEKRLQKINPKEFTLGSEELEKYKLSWEETCKLVSETKSYLDQIEKNEVLFLLGLPKSERRKHFIEIGLSDAEDLKIIGIDQSYLKQASQLREQLQEKLTACQSMDETDPLKHRTALLSFKTFLSDILSENQKLCAEISQFMEKFFALDEFSEHWCTTVQPPFMKKIKDKKQQLDELEVGSLSCAKEIIDLAISIQSILKDFLSIEKLRLYLLLQHYANQPNLLDTLKSLNVFLSLKGLKKAKEEEISDPVELMKFFYTLERNIPRRLVD